MFQLTNSSIDSATGSVAGDAFMLALLCGFESVAITGFDFSFSDNIIYAKNTAYQNRYAHYFNNRFKTAETFNASYIFKSSRALIVEGRYTRRSFVNYRDSLNNLIKEKNFKNIYTLNRKGLKLTNTRDIDFDAFMKLPALDNENKSEYIHKINMEKSAGTFDIKPVKDKLLDERIFNEIVEASLGGNLSDNKKKRIVSLIESI
jgi:hypothetical protein